MYVSDIEDHLRTPESRELLARYRQAQRAGGLPHVRLIDSVTMRTIGRDLTLVEKNAHGEFEYLYFGEALQRLTGSDLTGKSTAHQSPQSGASARRTFLKTLELRAPLFAIDREAENGRVHLWGRLHLPLDDGRGGIVICSYNRPREYSDELLREILDAAADGILAVRATRDGHGNVIDGAVLAANAPMLEMLRREQQDVLATPVSRLFPELRREGLWEQHVEVLQTRQCLSYEAVLERGGTARWYRIVAAPMNDGLVISFTDITELKQLNMMLEEQRKRLTEEMERRTLVEQELWNLAHLDPLTNVANRRSMKEQSIATLKLAARNEVSCAMIVIDIDYFKRINDTYGHSAGDKAIQAVATAAQSCCRSQRDILARTGGEEFAMLLYDANATTAIAIAERLRQRIEQMTISDGANAFTVTISCGVAESREGLGYEEFLVAADRALYSAKNDGRNRTHTEEGRKAA
ncbi:MAG TPA: sensor domain-containing diguanylate cyclase [Beijerinckiaceae bacterium]|nr:sensor domain-containing diguanylate cyclase [Beijerinckiaceae bacterium]